MGIQTWIVYKLDPVALILGLYAVTIRYRQQGNLIGVIRREGGAHYLTVFGENPKRSRAEVLSGIHYQHLPMECNSMDGAHGTY